MGRLREQSPSQILQADHARPKAARSRTHELDAPGSRHCTRHGDSMKRFWKRLRRRRQLDRDLEDELRFHLEQSGDPRRFGNATAFREACRDLWAFTLLESWGQDIRYAARTLTKNAGVTIVAALALALGIGANTTVFTVVHSALSFRFGVDHVDRLVIISASDADGRSLLTGPA